MPLTLSTPVTRIINEVGDTFEVEHCKLDFANKKAEFFWRIKTQTEKVLKQGTETLEDKDQPLFTNWYNVEYKTHADLVNKVAELAGYSGTFISENLI